MNRNCKKQIAEGDKIITANERLDLFSQDLHFLLDKAIMTKDANDILYAVVDAYKMGLAVGTRNGKRKAAAV